MDTTQSQPPVDQTALALSRAIRKAEGGDYNNTSGDNGTSAGAYQFNNGKLPLKKGEIPANFKSWASEEGLDPDDFSPANQDHVAYSRIKKKLDSGQSQSSIAAEWNSGLSKGWENHVGDIVINGKMIHYDTPAYVNKVKNFYGKNDDSQNTSSGVTDTIVKNNNPESPAPTSSGVVDTVVGDENTTPSTPEQSARQQDISEGNPVSVNPNKDKPSLLGGLIRNLIKMPLEAGLSVAAPFSKNGLTVHSKYLGDTSDLVTMTSNKSKELAGRIKKGEITPAGAAIRSLGSSASNVANLVGTLAGEGTLAKGAFGLFKGASALTSPALEQALPVSMDKFATASATKKLNILQQALKYAESNPNGGMGDKVLLNQAIKEVSSSSQLAKELGIAPSLLKKATTSGGGLIGKLLKNHLIQLGGGAEIYHLYNKYIK